MNALFWISRITILDIQIEPIILDIQNNYWGRDPQISDSILKITVTIEHVARIETSAVKYNGRRPASWRAAIIMARKTVVIDLLHHISPRLFISTHRITFTATLSLFYSHRPFSQRPIRTLLQKRQLLPALCFLLRVSITRYADH